MKRLSSKPIALTLGVGIVLTLAIAYSPLRLAVAYHQHPTPNAILMLGGSVDREHFTATFAQGHPDLPIWISTGSPQRFDIFEQSAIPADRITFDDRATDTVTNFTTLADALQQRNVHHIYLITSDYHMPRAQAIATFVLGSRGIAFTPIPIPSGQPPESRSRVVRDIGRSILWVFTGRTGASLNPRYWPEFSSIIPILPPS